MNQIQVIGSHNSYHVGIAPSEVKLMTAKNLKLYQALEYRHRPVDQQLNSGMCQIELDIFADSQGGRYAHPQDRMQWPRRVCLRTQNLTPRSS
jgi:hypothetical protein